jgi:hypothetical protein
LRDLHEFARWAQPEKSCASLSITPDNLDLRRISIKKIHIGRSYDMKYFFCNLVWLLLFSARVVIAASIELPSQDDIAALAKGNNDFACDMYAQLKTNQGNLSSRLLAFPQPWA